MLKLKHFITCLVLALPMVSHATCIKVTSTSSLSSEITAAGYIAKSWTGVTRGSGGNIGLPSVISVSSSDSFMPAGTLLASSTASFITAASTTALTSNQILYRCALADAGSLYEVYSTQSYTAYSGLNETSDIESAYHTFYNGVAIRLTNIKSGNYFSGYWQSREITSDEYVTDATYIYIPASAFSDVYVEIFKTGSTVYTAGNSANYYLFANNMASGFSTLRGPGMNASLSDGLLEGANYGGWFATWPGQFAMYNNVTFVRGAMCLVKDYPSVVLLPTISTSSLNNGEVSQSNFDISLSCEDSAISSVSKSTSSSANVAMGFLVNQSTAVTAATALGLTSTSGLTHLLDTNYGSSGVASGVGIRIYDESGNALNLLSSKTATTGNTGGWYAYKDLTTSQGDSTDGITTYTGNFTASLEAISGETVTAGSVNAQLQVVVSFQ
ncbi:fimbrial usher protein StbD [Rahnella inusitata]|uniref:fimbrial usher protein StbD n=1 Tax=Rahnella inusitata TaxID=58169 RepID=UPI0039BEBB5A